MDAPAREKEFKDALKIIAEHRNSSLLKHYIETGEIVDARTWSEPAAPPSNDRPVGLEKSVFFLLLFITEPLMTDWLGLQQHWVRSAVDHCRFNELT